MHVEFTPEFWNDRYRLDPADSVGSPNAQLLAEVADLAPGNALDVGCGEGDDAIWLAERGWRVTAADISIVALERARAFADARGHGDRIAWVQADLSTWTPPPGAFALVSAQFMYLPAPERDALFRRLAAAVEPGGTLLIVGHHPADLQTTMPRPPDPTLFYTAADVVALLEPHAWEIIVTGSRTREKADPNGNMVTITDAIVRARRRV